MICHDDRVCEGVIDHHTISPVDDMHSLLMEATSSHGESSLLEVQNLSDVPDELLDTLQSSPVEETEKWVYDPFFDWGLPMQPSSEDPIFHQADGSWA